MIFSVEKGNGAPEHLSERTYSSIGLLEREDLEEWAIEEPRILGEDLLVVTSEFEGFARTRDRLDILALDRAGKLVVVELKRDRADETTDLQTIKYASYCATLTPRQVQEEYRDFWVSHRNESLTPEAVGETFAEFLNENSDEEIVAAEDGWADFELDDKPRILLAAGSYGIEVTSPVLWLIEEYGMNITCVRIRAYEHRDRILLDSQQVIPIAEAEEYVTKRREKEQERKASSRRRRAIVVLLERDVLEPGDFVQFDSTQILAAERDEFGLPDEFWRAKITGDTGRSDNVKWLYDNQTYSFTRLTKQLLHELVGRDTSKPLNGYKYWCPEDDDKTLSEIRGETN
jgi:hypothetical protein